MTGAGTQDNPLVCYTASELHYALQQNGAYIKLGREIDCNEDLRSWPKCTVLAKELDLNNFDLLNIYAENDSVVFDVVSVTEQFVVKNGRILNMILLNSALTTQKTFSVSGTAGDDIQRYGIIFDDVGLVMRVSGASTSDSGNVIARGTFFNYCNANIHCRLSKANHYLTSSQTNINQPIQFFDSKLVLDIEKTYATENAVLIHGVGCSAAYYNSRAEINCHSTLDYSGAKFYPLGSSSACTMSVFDIQYLGNARATNICNPSYMDGVSIYNSDRFQVTEPTEEMIGVTTELMKDADYLGSFGFHCEKV